jgi:hypothetical protein
MLHSKWPILCSFWHWFADLICLGIQDIDITITHDQNLIKPRGRSLIMIGWRRGNSGRILRTNLIMQGLLRQERLRVGLYLR